MTEILIHEPVLSLDSDYAVYSARISIPRCRDFVLGFKTCRRYASYLTDTSDPFLIACLYFAMHEGHSIRIAGSVSSGLLNNLRVFQTRWAEWRPAIYSAVDLNAGAEVKRDRVDTAKAILAFSGGLDCSCSAYFHTRLAHESERRNLRGTLMVHGFDIPLNETEMFARAYRKATNALSSLGIEVIPMATNLRKLPMLWIDCFGCATASCLTVFSREFSEGLIASSMCRDTELLPHGSNRHTDPYTGSDGFKVIHDTDQFERLEKLEQILRWPEGLANLRVCYKNRRRDQNCGHCEKCVRTKLCFRALGAQPTCFEDPEIDLDALKRLKPHEASVNGFYLSLIRRAEADRRQEPWLEAVKEMVAKQKQTRSSGLEDSRCRLKLFVLKNYLRASSFYQKGLPDSLP